MAFIILNLFYTINLICLHESLHTPESGYFLPYSLCMALHFLLDKIQNTAWWTTLSTMGSWLPNSAVLWSCHLPPSKWVKAQPRSQVPKKPTFLPTPKAIRTLILPESPPNPISRLSPILSKSWLLSTLAPSKITSFWPSSQFQSAVRNLGLSFILSLYPQFLIHYCQKPSLPSNLK